MTRVLTTALLACTVCSGLWSASPASGSILIVGEMTRELTVAPGDRSEGKLILRNTGDAPQDVRIYQTDYLFTADGHNEYGEPGKLSRSNAKWFTFTPHQLTVPAQSTGTVYYTAQVPTEGLLKGTYWSMVMVEPVSAEGLEPSGDGPERRKVGIRTVTRYGIQLVTNVGRDGKADIRFMRRTLVASDQRVLLQSDVENTGEVWLSPTVWVELYDADGATVGRFSSAKQRLYPGCSARFTVDLTDVPKGSYDALIVVDNGDDNVFGTQARVEIK
jgi:hypothetical protein